jgi:hypothetical protein
MNNKLEITGGLIAFILTLLSEIPIYPPENWVIDFKIFTFGNTEIYFWGYLINNNIGFSAILFQFPENIMALTIWISIILIGLGSIMASLKNTKPRNSKLLLKINIFLLVYLITIFGIIILLQIIINFIHILNLIGLGFYLTLIILILNLISLKSLKNE